MSKKKSRTGGGSAKKTKNEQQNIRRAKYVQGWKDLNIDSTIITRNKLRDKDPAKVSKSDLADLKRESRKVRTERTKKQRAKEREQFLISEGYKKKDIKKSWLTSDKLMYRGLGRTNPNEIFHAQSYLALAFTNIHGASVILNTSEYKTMTFTEIKERIAKRIMKAIEDPDGSDSMTCVFQMFQGTQEECEEMLDGFSQRGYNLNIKKLTDKRYHRLVNRNDWTMREFAEMVLCVLEQCHNKDVPMLLDQFRFFIDENNLPFDEIFTG